MPLIIPHTIRRLVRASTVIALAACGRAAPPEQVTRRTVGDTTFVSSPADGVDGAMRLEPVLRIDAAKLDLGRIDAGVFGPDGTLWIYDGRGTDGDQLRVLDSLGTPVAVAGRRGEGPGEFRGPARVFALSDGSMLLKEMSTTRALRFDRSGRVLATIELPVVVASGWVVTPDTAGGWYITASFEEHTPSRVGRYGWLHFNNAGAVIDTAFPPAKFFEEPTPDGVAPGRIRTVGRDGSMLTTAPGASRMLRIARDGKVISMEWRAPLPEYLPDERRDLQVIEDKMNDLFHQARTPLPDRKEPSYRILTDATGVTWANLSTQGVRIPDDELPKEPSLIPPRKWRDRDRWAAFDRDGVLQFVIETPDSARVLDRSGKRVLGVVQDGEGMQSLVVWRVTPRTNR
jgi:hypothetical protein